MGGPDFGFLGFVQVKEGFRGKCATKLSLLDKFKKFLRAIPLLIF